MPDPVAGRLAGWNDPVMKQIIWAVTAGVVVAAGLLYFTHQSGTVVLPDSTYTVRTPAASPQPGRWQLPVGVRAVHQASPTGARLFPVDRPTPVPADLPVG